MPLTERILPDGICLLTEPIAATKAAAIGFWFPAGSRDESPDETGITHFIEHMLFKGTDSFQASDIARYFDRIGGYVNAFTERELVCVLCMVPSAYAEESLEMMCRMIWESVLSDEEIERERSVIESEILASCDDPDECGMEKALSLMYPCHPISRPIAGKIKDVESLDPEKIRSFYRSKFRTIRPLVAVAGAVSPDKIEEVLLRFSAGRKLVDPVVDRVSPSLMPGRFYPISRFSQSQIFLSYPLFNVKTSQDWFAWEIINAIIGDTVSSRLFQSLRERQGLCYSLYSFFVCNRDSSLWTACVSAPPEKTAKAVDSLLKELHEIRQSGFSAEEIRNAKSHIEGELLLSAEDTENRMKRLARQYFYNGTVATIEASVSIIKSIETETIEKNVKAAFCACNESLIVYGNKKPVKECSRLWPSR